MDLSEMNYHESYILARYMYCIGSPILTDATYDKLHDILVEKGELKEYTSRCYEDDPVPIGLLEKFGILRLQKETTKRDTSFLAEDLSTSIRKVESMEETYQFFKKFRGASKIVSIKMDGVNIKSEIDKKELKLSLTRGRKAQGFDVTDAMLKLMPKNMFLPGRFVVTGEAFVPQQHLLHFKEKYDSSKHKTTRTSALSILRRYQSYDDKDFEFLKFYAFYADGLGQTVEEMYKHLEDAGFCVPPYMLLEAEPDSYDEFCIWLTEIMDRMYDLQLKAGLPADGLVIQLNDNSIQTKITNQYDERQIAVKFSHWSSKIYDGVITSIIIEQRRVFCCCKVTIEPVITSDGCEAVVINTFNPSFLLNNNLKVGSTIQFARQSGTVNVFCNGTMLDINRKSLED